MLTLINGTEEEKANLIALGLYTMKAFGVQIALNKGERGQQVQWIGVKMLLQWPESPLKGSITYAAPKKMMDELLETLMGWMHRELRSTTWRLSWVAGILPRLRWAVSVFFAVLRDAEEDERTGLEEERAQNRKDRRPKYGLVAVKRFGATLRWLSWPGWTGSPCEERSSWRNPSPWASSRTRPRWEWERCWWL